MIELTQHPILLSWAADILKVKFDASQAVWISHLKPLGGGEIDVEAVVVFTRFSTHNCEMSIATNGKKRWATRAFMRTCYRFAFEQLKLARITVVIEHDNETSLRMCRKLGHTEEGRLKHWFGDKDGILMRMTRQECKWL